MKKHLLLASCLLSSLLMSAWEYPSGDNPQSPVEFYSYGLGTIDEPYVITTAQQLANFSFLVNSGINYADTYIELGNDISLENADTDKISDWVSIGTSEHPFRGNFDGKNHTISGLRQYSIVTAKSYYAIVSACGMFGKTESANISNINLDKLIIDLKFCAEDFPDLDYMYVGGLVGCMNKGRLTSCNVSGKISIATADYNEQSYGQLSGLYGGIAGEARDLDLISDCQFDGMITVSDPGSTGTIDTGIGGICSIIYALDVHDLTNNGLIECTEGKHHVGGIAAGLHSEDGSGLVTNLFNNGEVRACNGVAAGISHWFYCYHIENCHNTGDISSNTAACYGITSDSHFRSAKKCSNKGKVKGSGLIGYGDFLTLMEDCVNYADVTGAGLLSEIGVYDIVFRRCVNYGKAQSAGIAGGSLAGYISITMEDCHNYGDITGAGGLCAYAANITIKSCSNSGKIDGTNYYRNENLYSYYPSYSSKIGGLIGRASTAVIEDCENTGDVTGPHISGGLVGCDNEKSTISNCRNSGAVSSIFNPLMPVEFSLCPFAGGLIGYTSQESVITDCSNSGTVTFDNKQHNTYSEIAVGGLAGQYSGSIKNSHNQAAVNINVEKNPESNRKCHAGGIIGLGKKLNISNCYNTGNVSGNADVASGLIAYKDGFMSSGTDVALADSYSACDVETSDGKAIGLIALGEGLPIKSCFSYSQLKGSEIYPIGYLSSSYAASEIENTFYLTSPDMDLSAPTEKIAIDAIAVPADEFATGSVCVALNNGRSTDAPWGQTPGVDSYPLLNGAGDPEGVGGIDDITADTPSDWTIYTTDGIIVDKNIHGSLGDVTNSLDKGLYILISRDGKSVKIIK